MNIDTIKPTAAVALADIARTLEHEGKKVVKLQTGDPDFPTHDVVISAANKAMADGYTHYSFTQGLPVLRDKLASLINEEINSELTKDNLLITHGAAQAFASVMSSLLEENDEVLIFEPNWPTIDSLVTLNGGKPIKIDSTDLTNITARLDALCTPKTVMVSFNSPNNPTGQVLPQDVIDTICKWAIDKDLYIVADEVYRFLQYDNTSTSIQYLSSYSKYIFIDSFSKKYAMTGWRIGYVASSSDVIKKITKSSQLTITNVAPFSQLAALEALSNAESLAYSEKMKEEYANRCEHIKNRCSELGLEYIVPEGAFYLFIKLPEGVNDVDFCNDLLYQKYVCVVPGSGFGKAGTGYVRISYANELATVLKGIELIYQTINEL